uniref:NADH dehydrogenase subunit 4L n=1 Tax=Menacanthus cornutus TaxID=1491751 RepID=UPI00200075FD|nr:NADH dehydrogenase subunit 4L [Menacanthus cornutus]UNZ12998.1 NADH dehydrogenase subunit 4L [Menacanthus cornutus]
MMMEVIFSSLILLIIGVFYSQKLMNVFMIMETLAILGILSMLTLNFVLIVNSVPLLIYLLLMACESILMLSLYVSLIMVRGDGSINSYMKI